MSSGAELVVTVPVQVTDSASAEAVFTNTASVATTSLEENLANNSNSGQVTVESGSLAGLVFRDFNDNGVQDPGDTGIGGVTTLLDQYDVLKDKGVRRVSPHTVPMLMPNSPAANVRPVLRAAPGPAVRSLRTILARGSEASSGGSVIGGLEPSSTTITSKSG